MMSWLATSDKVQLTLKNWKKKQVTQANEGARDCLYEILQSFAETNFDRLTAADCYRFLGVPETATQQENCKKMFTTPTRTI